MKNIATITQDGLEGSIELIKFLKECNDDLYESIIALVGNSATVFITGGAITEALGNTTITDGIILKDGKLYRFTGGTVAGNPSGLNVLFESNLAPGYAPVYFDGDPIPKDIYIANTARIDATGSIVLSSIGYVTDMITAKPILDAVGGKAGKNAYSILSGIIYSAGFLGAAGSHPEVKEFDSGLIRVSCWFNFSGAKPADTNILTGLPNTTTLTQPFPVFVDNNSATAKNIGWCQLTPSGTIQVVSGFTTGMTQCWFTHEYSKG